MRYLGSSDPSVLLDHPQSAGEYWNGRTLQEEAPPPPTKGTIVGTNEIYRWEGRAIFGTRTFGTQTPPSPPPLFYYSPAPIRAVLKFSSC